MRGEDCRDEVGLGGWNTSVVSLVETWWLSKDAERPTRMNQAVGFYRMAFAQPRQDDLQRSHAPAALEALAAAVFIDLQPSSNKS